MPLLARLAPALTLLVAALPAAAQDGGPRPAFRGDAGVSREMGPGVPDGGTEMEDVLDEAMKKIALKRSAEARQMFKRKDYPGALARYREAHELDPRNPEISNNLAYIYYLLGNPEEAERLYRWSLSLDPERFIAHINLADLLYEKSPTPDRLAEAAQLLVQARELKGNRPRVIIRQARISVAMGEFDDAERFYGEYLALRKPTDKLRLELGDFLRDQGRSEEALEWYRQIDDEDLGKIAASRIWEIEVERQTRKYGWTASPDVIPARARMLARRGRISLGKGDLEQAERLLAEALSLAPGFAEARADQGDLYQQTGRPMEAELAYLRAIAIDQGNADVHARLGDLYMDPGPEEEPRSAMAAIFLARALQLRPDWTELHLKLAMALRGAGDLVGALTQVNTYLRSAQGTRNQATAMSMKRSLEVLIPAEAMAEPNLLASSLAPTEEMSERLVMALASAKAHLARGETDAAMADLRRLEGDDRGVYVLNLEARILMGAGRTQEAARTLEEFLRHDEDQAIVHEQLGAILIELGEEGRGRIHLTRAEELGDLEATYHLARLDAGETEPGLMSWTDDMWRVGELLAARDRLDRFLATGSAAMFRKEASILRDQVGERLTALVLAAAAAALLVIVAMVVAWRRLWGGCDLRDLIEKHPETGPEVQRILSAVRHEVLKHNTMMLAGLVSSMERGEDVTDQAIHFSSSLLGPDGETGILARLQGYVAQLARIGDANRERLNLRRRDPAISPLLKGTRLLERSAPSLSRYGELSDNRRASLMRDLKSASRLLNTEGYEAVRGLLDRLRILAVDEALLTGLFERCAKEPSFSGIYFAPLTFETGISLPFGIPIPRADFEDIVANLIRNAVQSSIKYGAARGDVRIGLRVDDEIDDVTGIERAVLFVLDRSGEELTAEMLRGRYIEEGLGLTADLVSRYDGTLDVREGDGEWSKEVVVKLPMALIEQEGREVTRRVKNG